MSRTGPGVVPGVVLPPPPPQYDVVDQRETRRLIQQASKRPPQYSAITSIPAPVTALSRLIGAADTVPYFTGISAMALAALTPYARTILACSTALAVRMALGDGDSTHLFKGDGSLATATESNITLADVTTLDVSTTKHGLTPKLPGDVTKFLDGNGNWTVAGTTLPTFPFTSATGLMFRWNASLGNKTLNSLGYATKIFDMSGNGRDSAVSTIPPKWIDGVFMGKFPGIYFDLGHRLMINSFPSIGSPFAATICFVGMAFGSSGNSHIYNWSGNPIGFGATTPLDFMYNLTLPAAHPVSSDTSLHKPINDPWRQPVIGIHSYNGASSVQSLNNNEATINPGIAATGAVNGFAIGADSATTAGSFARMLLVEICVLNFAANSTQRQALLAYYKSLYGLTTP